MSKFWDVVTLFLTLSVVVLVVTHSTGFAAAVTAVGGQINQWGTTLTGTNVTNAVYPGSITTAPGGIYSIA